MYFPSVAWQLVICTLVDSLILPSFPPPYTDIAYELSTYTLEFATTVAGPKPPPNTSPPVVVPSVVTPTTLAPFLIYTFESFSVPLLFDPPYTFSLIVAPSIYTARGSDSFVPAIPALLPPPNTFLTVAFSYT